MKWLEGHFENMLGGGGKLVFLTGEAGARSRSRTVCGRRAGSRRTPLRDNAGESGGGGSTSRVPVAVFEHFEVIFAILLQ
jgi:hypothetical protein